MALMIAAQPILREATNAIALGDLELALPVPDNLLYGHP
jgi:hypothetical protein